MLLLLLAGCAKPAPEESPAPSETLPPPSASPAAEAVPFVLPCYAAASFHPITGGNRTNLTLAGLLYEGLFAVTPDFKAEPVLCSEYTVSEDGLAWTFTLDASARFSDGSALAPADVVYSLNLARQSALYSQRLSEISGVAA